MAVATPQAGGRTSPPPAQLSGLLPSLSLRIPFAHIRRMIEARRVQAIDDLFCSRDIPREIKYPRLPRHHYVLRRTILFPPERCCELFRHCHLASRCFFLDSLGERSPINGISFRVYQDVDYVLDSRKGATVMQLYHCEQFICKGTLRSIYSIVADREPFDIQAIDRRENLGLKPPHFINHQIN